MAAEKARQRGQIEAGGNADDNGVTQFADERGDGFLHLLRLDRQHQQIADAGQHFGRFQAVDRVSLLQLVARFATRIDHGDVSGGEALFQHAADQRIGHVAAAEEGNFHAWFLSPKMAVPMRTMVAPSATAASRSWDMPMDRVSSGKPAARIVAKISRSRRNGARWAVKSSAGSGMAIRPRKFSRGKAAIAWHSARASVGRATALAGFAGDIHLDTDLQWRQRGRPLRREPFGNLEALDRMHPGEMFGNQARLVALQRADEMPLQIEVDRGPCLVDRLLDVILSECPLSGPVCGNHALDRPCLADCQKTYFSGQTTRVDSCFGDT